MDLSARSPLLDSFKRGDAPPDARLAAARGGLAARGTEQLEMLTVLVSDVDAGVADAARSTIEGLHPAAVAACLARQGVSAETKAFFASRGIVPGLPDESDDAPLVEQDDEIEPPPADEREGSTLQRIAALNVAKRIAVAMKGTREERAILIRDPNRIVAAAVLSSPKMTETEIAGIARMANVSEDVLRTIANNRSWLKNYQVALGLAKNPKTPVALSLNLLGRLTEKDLRLISTDRNVPDVLRVSARKKIVIDK
jgi:hypothetical protein